MASKENLRIGIIGFGGAGMAHWNYFHCLPGCRVTKILDPKPGGRERASRLLPAGSVFPSTQGFWNDLDAVSICAPDSQHADYIVEALANGLHVVSEKPLTDSVEGIRKIKAAEAKSDRIVAVVHQMRFVPLFQKARQAVASGELGTVSYAEGYYVHNLVHRAFAFDDWRKTDNATPLVYSGCHFVDALRWMLGAEVVEVYAAANHLNFPDYPESDLNLVTLRFASGALGKVVVAFGAGGPQDHSLRVYGDRASIDNNSLFRADGSWGRILHEPIIIQKPLLPHPMKSAHYGWVSQVRSHLPAWLLGRAFLALRWLARRPNSEYGGRYYPVRLYEHALACLSALQDFVDAIREHRRPLCTVDEAARTVLVCLAGVQSYRTNRPIRVARLEELL